MGGLFPCVRNRISYKQPLLNKLTQHATAHFNGEVET